LEIFLSVLIKKTWTKQKTIVFCEVTPRILVDVYPLWRGN